MTTAISLVNLALALAARPSRRRPKGLLRTVYKLNPLP
jgi:hypothetical protein